MSIGASSIVRTGGIHLSVEIRADAEELALWHPDTVKALMQGVAAILSAQQQAREISAGLKVVKGGK